MRNVAQSTLRPGAGHAARWADGERIRGGRDPGRRAQAGAGPTPVAASRGSLSRVRRRGLKRSAPSAARCPEVRSGGGLGGARRASALRFCLRRVCSHRRRSRTIAGQLGSRAGWMRSSGEALRAWIAGGDGRSETVLPHSPGLRRRLETSLARDPTGARAGHRARRRLPGAGFRAGSPTARASARRLPRLLLRLSGSQTNQAHRRKHGKR